MKTRKVCSGRIKGKQTLNDKRINRMVQYFSNHLNNRAGNEKKYESTLYLLFNTISVLNNIKRKEYK